MSYVDYFEAVLPKLAAHGLIVVDNTLRIGRRLATETRPHEGARRSRLQRQGRQRPAGRVVLRPSATA